MSTKIERADMIESGGHLSHCNLNQRRLKWIRDTEVKGAKPKKEQRARMKHEREFEETLAWERQKQNRIWSRVERALEGYDEVDCGVLRSEIDFIVRHGVTVVTNL